jgi:hypothetical protein
LVKKTKPRSSYCFISTVRELGRPSAAAVETIIAFGSWRPLAAASANQRANWPYGSGASSRSERPWAR